MGLQSLGLTELDTTELKYPIININIVFVTIYVLINQFYLLLSKN